MIRFNVALGLAAAFVLLNLVPDSARAEKLVYNKEPKLRGEVCIPEGPGPFPAVVFNHGGEGFSRGRGVQSIGGDPSGTCKALAKAGFVGFAPIRRPKAKWNVHVDDILAAIDTVKKLSVVDPNRVAMIGFSSGGLVTLLTAIRQPDLKALVVMAGAANNAMKTGTEKYARIRAPILILIAENDTGSKHTKGVNTLEGMQFLHAELKDMGRDVTLIVYPPFGNDGHALFFEVRAYWTDVVEFLKQHFEDSVPPPAQAAATAKPQKMLKRMDSDGDGRIAQSEWQGPPPAFAKIDADGDEVITPDELARWVEQRQQAAAGPAQGGQGPGPAQGGPSPEKALARMDDDGDGRIARSEWKGPPPAFAKIDANADKFLEFDELAAWFAQRQ